MSKLWARISSDSLIGVVLLGLKGKYATFLVILDLCEPREMVASERRD